jgi:hypothetical protein
MAVQDRQHALTDINMTGVDGTSRVPWFSGSHCGLRSELLSATHRHNLPAAFELVVV